MYTGWGFGLDDYVSNYNALKNKADIPAIKMISLWYLAIWVYIYIYTYIYMLRVRKDHQIQVQDNRFIHSGTSQHNNIFALENK